jgi:hypothetical protein
MTPEELLTEWGAAWVTRDPAERMRRLHACCTRDVEFIPPDERPVVRGRQALADHVSEYTASWPERGHRRAGAAARDPSRLEPGPYPLDVPRGGSRGLRDHESRERKDRHHARVRRRPASVMTGNGPCDARQVRDALGHVVIDADAHHVEVSVAFADFVRDHGGGRLLDDPAVRAAGLSDAAGELVPSLAERRRLHLSARPVWWTPSDTLDYATVAMPALYRERLQEAGIDFAVVYPSRGLTLLSMENEDTRVGLSRLYNSYVAQAYAPYRDRISPAAVIPAHTPAEGIAALEHAVSLGLGAMLMPSFVWRPIPAFADADPRYRSRLQRVDNFGLDSEYDYDPFWAKAVELDVPLACHTSGFRLAGHFSPSNYSYAAGHFARSCSWRARLRAT